MAKKKKEQQNLLEMVPVRVYEWEENEIVKVKIPRFKSKVGKRFCRAFKKEQTYNVNLDKYGSEAWKLCDGDRTIEAIGSALKEKFGDEVEPVNERIAELFQIMEANGLITYKNK
jgi:hypothetical protein